jgi:pimeloyl-ACP methyl ester carboxylesterase
MVIIIDYYCIELQTLIDTYALENYYLFGSSWGTIVAQEFAVLKPAGLRGLVLDGALSDPELYISSQWRERISTLPLFTQNTLQKLIAEKDFQNPIFKAINENVGIY